MCPLDESGSHHRHSSGNKLPRATSMERQAVVCLNMELCEEASARLFSLEGRHLGLCCVFELVPFSAWVTRKQRRTPPPPLWSSHFGTYPFLNQRRQGWICFFVATGNLGWPQIHGTYIPHVHFNDGDPHVNKGANSTFANGGPTCSPRPYGSQGDM